MISIFPTKQSSVQPMQGGCTAEGPIIWMWMQENNDVTIKRKDTGDTLSFYSVDTIDSSEFPDMAKATGKSSWLGLAFQAKGFFKRLVVSGLAEGERLNTIVSSGSDTYALEITRPPSRGDLTNFSFVLGSCLDDPRQKDKSAIKILHTIGTLGDDGGDIPRPDFMIMGGDSTYYIGGTKTGKTEVLSGDMRSTLKMLERQMETRTKSGMKQISQRMPVLSTWDDHDFAWNDSRGGEMASDIKQLCRQIFTAMWPNDHSDDECDTIRHAFRWGSAAFFFTDGRYLRDPDKEQILGSGQKQWLESKLRAAVNDDDGLGCRLLVVVSGTQVVPQRTADDEGEEPFENFFEDAPGERTWLIECLQKIMDDNQGVKCLILSGDIHSGEVACSNLTGAAACNPGVVEVTSSPLLVKSGSKLKPQEDHNSTRLIAANGEHFCEIRVKFDDCQENDELGPRIEVYFRNEDGGNVDDYGTNISGAASATWYADGLLEKT